ncbi:hypothetical protein F4561_004281 [Lipingzhangella halophila]|uniref:YcaO domain-containing protein n=1 Tax=Lipingzhangella halophila TaxID=1783352 RepID=A0A7W7RL12_9ACTN|nr:hypothetical protein [Lipingzhangella halophila]MBB4933461.1 hypothetical protein [Lipingzhangella halophila]
MKLLLRPEAYRAATENGICFHTHEGLVSLTGTSVAQWVDRLAPHLDGTRSLGELTAGLDAVRAELVERLVTELVSAGVVREVPGPGDPEPTTGSPEERFLAYFLPEPGPAFTRYRDGGALVVGSSPIADAVARACADSGIAKVGVVTTDNLAHDPGELAGRVSDTAVVLHARTGPDLRTARLLRELCAGSGAVLGHVVLLGQELWHGPVGRVGEEAATWESGWRRLVAAGRVPEETAGPNTPERPGERAITVAATQLAHRAFRAASGLAPRSEQDELVRIDPRSYASEHHAFLAHPFETEQEPDSETRFTATVAELGSGEPLDETAMSQRTAPLLDRCAGVLLELNERAFTQTPLHVSAATVADPAGLLGPSGQRPTVIGVGTEPAAARYEAALLGYAAYGSLMVDPRRLLGSDLRTRYGDTPEDALHELRSGHRPGFVRGYRLRDQRPCAVPAERAFAVLTGTAPPAWPVTGSAAGYTWREALERALLGHCRALALRHAAASTTPFPAVGLSAAPLDEQGERYRGTLRALGLTPEIHDLGGLLGVPCYLFRVAGTPVSCAVGLTSERALTAGLLDTLLHYQAHHFGDPEYAPPEVPDLPPELRGRPQTPETRSVGLDALVRAAEHAGTCPVAVPLDHDPEVSRRMPYTVQVVLDNG